MKYLSLPDNATRILPFYLAMEEYAACIIEEDDIFFMWQASLLGVEVGSQNIRGFVEAGAGEQGILLAGIKYKF